MNLIVGLIVFIFGSILGIIMLRNGFEKSGESKNSFMSFLWTVFVVIGFCLMPASFLLGNYISLVLKPF